jgi:hypothetical protein
MEKKMRKVNKTKTKDNKGTKQYEISFLCSLGLVLSNRSALSLCELEPNFKEDHVLRE